VYDWATEKAGTLEVPLHAVTIVTASTFLPSQRKIDAGANARCDQDLATIVVSGD
jgi:hypothetical protein